MSTRWFLLVVVLAAGCGGSAATIDEAERDAAGRIVGAGRVGTQQLRVGDCFLEPDAAAVLTVTGVPCSRSHDGQVTGRVTAAEADRWPGRDELSTQAAPPCLDAASATLSDAALAADIRLSAYVPDERSWGSGDRDIVCFVESAGPDLLEGDLLAGS